MLDLTGSLKHHYSMKVQLQFIGNIQDARKKQVTNHIQT